MATQRHPPPKSANKDDSDNESMSSSGEFSLCEYDLDVVDDALQNPGNSEFKDHFGFKIHVRTDDEDSSDSDSDPEDVPSKPPTTPNPTGPSRHSNGSSVHQKSLFSSDDDETSIDTAMTTPTTIKNHSLSISSLEEGISLGSTCPIPVENQLPPTQSPPPLPRLDTSPRQPSHRTRPRPDSYNKALPALPPNVSEEMTGRHHMRNNSNASTMSFSTFNPFRRPISPANSTRSSMTSIRQSSIERPSQAFRERQSRRMSEICKSPAQQTMSMNFQLGRTVPPPVNSYYEMLLAKFGRTSQESQQIDSLKQMALKEDTYGALELAQETSPSGIYDWDLWKRVISDPDKVVRTELRLLRMCIGRGVPSSMRGNLWQLFSKAQNNNGDLENEYRELLNRTSPHEKMIQRDLARTFPTHAFFKDRDGQGQQLLFNVIKAYSLFDQQVGYCQGLAFIVGCLLLYMSDDAAFCVLVKLMGQYGLRGHFTPQMESLHEHMYQFDNLLQQKYPEVHRHMELQGVDPSMYASQWLLTLFAYRCPLSLVIAVLDLVIAEGTQVVLQFALALIERNQATILSLSFEPLVEFLVNGIFNVYGDDRQQFVEDACAVDIPPRLLARLAKQYVVEAAREARIQSQEDQMRKLNSELSEHVRTLEKAYKTLESEYQEVTKQAIETKMAMAGMDNQNQEVRRSMAQLKADSESKLKEISHMYEAQIHSLQQDKDNLTKSNAALEDQLSDVESTLIMLKMECAERESEYEVTRRNLHTAQKNQNIMSS
ncbi:rab-GTPase-TBC domain-containing protein [Phycomyces nitens]|nr:rab-GTPase-TBC domain-containing protein [Phycomyces nitens]